MNENEKHEKVAQMVNSLELHQLQKLAVRARAGEELCAADLALLKRMGHKLESARSSSGAVAKKKVKRGRPMKTIHLAEQIERLALEKLLERQERGDKLTAAEFAFLAKIN